MKKLSCSSCGSTSVTIGKEHYTCNHCSSVYTLPKKDETQKEKRFFSFRIKVYLLLIVLNVMALNYYFFIYSEDEVQVSKAQEVIKVPKIQQMSFWNIMYDRKLLSEIDDLRRTDNESYLISGHNSWQNIYMAELDEKGKELWHKDFPNNVNGYSRVLDLKDGYIISSRGINNDKTIKLDKRRDIVYLIKHYFKSMVALEKEFIGVSKDRIIKIDKYGKIAWEQHFESRFDQVVMINDGNLIALGKSNNKKLSVVKFTKDGAIIWSKEINLSRFIEAKDAVKTKDGGFIIMAGNRIKILKFSSDGVLEFKTELSGYYPSGTDTKYYSPYACTVIEAKDGYITTSQVSKSSQILVAKLNLDGNVIWEKIYKNDKRLHARNIVKAYDGGYLMSVTTEIHNPWLVKMSDKGEIECNFEDKNDLDDKTEFITAKLKKEPSKYIENISTYLGARLSEMIYSKDEKYLYTIGGSTGFKIFDVSNKKKIIEVGGFLKTKLKLRVTPDYIGPIGRKYAGDGDLQYDSPHKLIISKDETKAYISDTNHGFYILDISNKTKPRLLGAIKGLKVNTFVLSRDENILYTYYDKKLVTIDVSEPTLIYKQEKRYTVDGWNNFVHDMKLSKSGKNLFVVDERMLIIHSIEDKKDITHYMTSSGISKMHIPNNEELVYLLKSNKGVDVVDIKDYNDFKIKNEIIIKGRYSSFSISENLKTMYLSGKGGVKVLDISNPLNAKVKNVYTDAGKNYVNSITLDEKTNKLFVAFAMPSAIGIVEY